MATRGQTFKRQRRTWHPWVDVIRDPITLELQERDVEIPFFIHQHGGFITRQHLVRADHFTSLSRAKARVRELVRGRYLMRTNANGTASCGDQILWNGEPAAREAASRAGIPWEEFRKNRWLIQPNFDEMSQLRHDLYLTDVVLTIQRACEYLAWLRFDYEEWRNEKWFELEGDSVPVRLVGGEEKQVVVRPDNYFPLLRTEAGKVSPPFRHLLELDNRGSSKNVLGDTKIKPWIRYIRDEKYLERFDGNSGRCLVVVMRKPRIETWLKAIAKFALQDAQVWYVAHYHEVVPAFERIEAWGLIRWQHSQQENPGELKMPANLFREFTRILTEPVWARLVYDKRSRQFRRERRALFSPPEGLGSG